ncbi:hypothetical protein HON36_04495 [Candidatus Parcubacteria bacterium]|jgi:hypothetical protein|nr:hypothetical protein [Candidatus Parcubacteria bacterium]
MSKNTQNLLFYGVLYLIFLVFFLILNYSPQNEPSSIHYDINFTKSYKPNFVRAIYLTAYSAGRDDFRKSIIEKASAGKINSVVIDIKDYTGNILYDSQVPAVIEVDAVTSRMDIEQVISDFHEADIYVIARQTVFQDPALASSRPDLAFKTWNGNNWLDYKGLAWLDPNKQEVWQYNLDIALEAIELGFDEINFDYMRYPSDGNMGNLNYNMPEGKTRTDVMKGFFKFLSDNLTGKAKISIDTFGLVMDHTDDEYDLNIGQRLTDAADYFDYVCPMMYPSHYPLQYLGYTNSAEHPGEVIAYGLKISASALDGKRAKIRPWLQAFHMRAVYDQTKIEAQETAVEKASATEGWLLWNARNYYPDFIF